MFRSVLWLLIAVVLVLTSGCARVATTTTLLPDGSFTRRIVFAVPKMDAMGAALSALPDKSGKTDNKAKSPTNPEDFFKIPASTAVATVVKSEDKDSLLVTVTQEIKPGVQPSADITLWAEKGKAMATSTVTVTKLPDGNTEYVETLRWSGPRDSATKLLDPDLRLKVKKLMPAEYQKTETIDAVARGVAANSIHAVLGPPEPVIGNLMFDREGAVRRAKANMYPANVLLFKREMPSLTDATAAAMARSILDTLRTDAPGYDNLPSTGSPTTSNSANNELTPLFFEVAFSGKVVETNGIIDPIDGHVYWSLLAMGIEFEDVKLRAVIRP